MFDHVLLDSPAEGASAPGASRRFICALTGALGWALVFCLLLLASLLSTNALPVPALTTMLPGPPLGRAPSPVRPHVMRPSRATRVVLAAPTIIPRGVARLKDKPQSQEIPSSGPDLIGSLPAGQAAREGLPGGLGTNWSPPPPAPRAAPSKPARLHIGGVVEAAKLIYQLKPEYPPLARLARVQGKVQLQAVISKDGTVRHLKVLEGHPLLVAAALEAVARWRYQPTLLNGEPVEVETEIDVTFTLNE